MLTFKMFQVDDEESFELEEQFVNDTIFAD